MRRINIAIFISDVGFGHIVREKEIAIQLFRVFKKISITFFLKDNINILKNKFTNYTNKKNIFYEKNFNNISLFTNKNGSLKKKRTITFLKKWCNRKDKSLNLYKKKLKKFDIFISDLVPEIFYYSKLNKKISFGICHYTWDWLFEEIMKNKSKETKLMNYYNTLAHRIYLPPFTPYKNLNSLKNYQEVNFIYKKEKVLNSNNRMDNNILIMDNGTGVISKLISKTIPYIQNLDNYFFYIGITYIDKKTIDLIDKSNNMILINKDLKVMYNYISKVDYVVARAGFNTITECLVHKKPSLLISEKNNPEIAENIKKVKSNNLCFEIKTSNFGKNFIKTLKIFNKKKHLIENTLHKFNFKYDGAFQIAKDIKKQYYSFTKQRIK